MVQAANGVLAAASAARRSKWLGECQGACKGRSGSRGAGHGSSSFGGGQEAVGGDNVVAGLGVPTERVDHMPCGLEESGNSHEVCVISELTLNAHAGLTVAALHSSVGGDADHLSHILCSDNRALVLGLGQSKGWHHRVGHSN